MPTPCRQGIQAAIDQLQSEGDTSVYFIEFPVQTGGYGCDWHPGLATHESMGTQLESELRNKLGW